MRELSRHRFFNSYVAFWYISRRKGACFYNRMTRNVSFSISHPNPPAPTTNIFALRNKLAAPLCPGLISNSPMGNDPVSFANGDLRFSNVDNDPRWRRESGREDDDDVHELSLVVEVLIMVDASLFVFNSAIYNTEEEDLSLYIINKGLYLLLRLQVRCSQRELC